MSDSAKIAALEAWKASGLSVPQFMRSNPVITDTDGNEVTLPSQTTFYQWIRDMGYSEHLQESPIGRRHVKLEPEKEPAPSTVDPDISEASTPESEGGDPAGGDKELIVDERVAALTPVEPAAQPSPTDNETPRDDKTEQGSGRDGIRLSLIGGGVLAGVGVVVLLVRMFRNRARGQAHQAHDSVNPAPQSPFRDEGWRTVDDF